MLVDAAAISRGAPKLGDARKPVEHGLKSDEPPRHRAEADARRLALAVTETMQAADIR